MTHEDVPAATASCEIFSKIRERGELPFRELMEIALYDPNHGYYSVSRSPIGPEGDYVTAPAISPVFAFALARLVREVVTLAGDDLCTVVDIGCGDGSLLAAISEELREEPGLQYLGIDRRLGRACGSHPSLDFADSLDAIPRDRALVVIANELYDAFPFARLVRRESGWNELWVREADGGLDWSEHPAPREYVDYLESTGVAFSPGQFADVSLEWGSFHRDLCGHVARGLVVVLDYGFRSAKLFDARIRRYGTAASYSAHRVHRDLLRDPGRQDLTAHVNFDDLEGAGEAAGLATLAFLRQAEFLLRLGVVEHPLLRPVDPDAATDVDVLAVREAREAARRLVLPDGIGEEISALVQGRGLRETSWSFQRALW